MRNAKFLAVSFVVLLSLVCDARPPKATVTLHVTDAETGEPVAAAVAGITFTIPNGQGGATDVNRTGLTDANGYFRAVDDTMPYISAGARKPGYYKTGVNVDLKPTLKDAYAEELLVPIILKPIVNPIPMYARKHARFEVPRINEHLGFDLISFDWLPPYGRGTVPDFIFTLTENISDTASKTLIITFSNIDDGIAPIDIDPKEGSALRLPATAPESGYVPIWTRVANKRYLPKKEANYFFRIRTVKDGPTIRSALYGKIHGDIGVDTINSKTALIFLTYYLNPDGTRNVEFDPNKNLFKNLSSLEQVIDP